MVTLPKSTLEILSYLQSNNIDPILYGSQGVSLYLGNFKVFSDVDLLINEKLLHDNWARLQTIMNKNGFGLIDEHEHEFRNTEGITVNFGDENILIRDKILVDLDEVINMVIGRTSIKTISPEAFKLAYEFSLNDGYRIETRGKKDSSIIYLLADYLKK